MNIGCIGSPRARRLQLAACALAGLLAVLACQFLAPSVSPVSALPPGPAVTIQQPANGLQVAQGDALVFFASADDPLGVLRLDLWVDDTLVLSQASPDADGFSPLSLSYPMVAVKAGTYTLVARAYNRQGQMGASAAHYVTVTDQPASTLEYAQYVVQEGDTLESIAGRLGVGANDTLLANPYLQGGQVAPGQMIVIPMPKPPAPPAAVPGPNGIQPMAVPPAGPQPPGQGNLPNNLPGILPQFRPGAIPVQDAGLIQVDPMVFPMAGIALGPDVGKVMEPGDLKAVSVNGCQVLLTWTDHAVDETSYEVHRLDPGTPHYHLVAQLNPNSARYEDRAPSPGRYLYYVAAIRTLNGATSGGGSSPALVDVTQVANCALTAGPKRLMFQPIRFKPNDGSISQGYVLLTLGTFPPIRVPRAGQDYLPSGDWSGAGEWAVPLPETAQLKPGDTLPVEVWGSGHTPSGPADLRGFQRVHTYESLADPAARSVSWSGVVANAQFELVYRLWLDNWLWGGQAPDPLLPAPTNLKLDMTDAFIDQLAWDYDPQAKAKIDGFIVYGKYSCPGGLQEMHYTVPRGVTGNVAADQQYAVDKHKQPSDCVCLYQVSAYTARGESPLSNPTTGRCETGVPVMNARVIFHTFGISRGSSPNSNVPHQAGRVYLFSGSFMRASAPLVLENGRTYDLRQLYFDGLRNNNWINARAAAEGSGRAVYTVFLSALVSPDICQLGPSAARFTDSAVTNGDAKMFTLQGSCGPDCTCRMDGEVIVFPNGQNPSAAPNGGWKQTGEACASDGDCLSSYCRGGVCTPDLKGLGGALCYANDQCLSGVCGCNFTNRSGHSAFGCPAVPQPNVTGTCVGPAETAVSNGGACSQSSDCASGHCANGKCAPVDGLGQVGEYCHHSNHCSNHYCVCPNGYDGDFCRGYANFTDKPGEHGTCGEWQGAADGAACSSDTACQSRHCADGICSPIDFTGLFGEACHHNNHCYSRECVCNDKDIFGLCWDKGGGYCAP